MADRRVLDPKPIAELECLGEVTRRHTNLVTVLVQRLDQRSHDKHVGTVGEVDPDAHLRGHGNGPPGARASRDARRAGIVAA